MGGYNLTYATAETRILYRPQERLTASTDYIKGTMLQIQKKICEVQLNKRVRTSHRFYPQHTDKTVHTEPVIRGYRITL